MDSYQLLSDIIKSSLQSCPFQNFNNRYPSHFWGSHFQSFSQIDTRVFPNAARVFHRFTSTTRTVFKTTRSPAMFGIYWWKSATVMRTSYVEKRSSTRTPGDTVCGFTVLEYTDLHQHCTSHEASWSLLSFVICSFVVFRIIDQFLQKDNLTASWRHLWGSNFVLKKFAVVSTCLVIASGQSSNSTSECKTTVIDMFAIGMINLSKSYSNNGCHSSFNHLQDQASQC